MQLESLQLAFSHFVFRFRAEGRVEFPPYTGSNWRTMLSWGLKRAVCLTREPRCADCVLEASCSYPFLIEPRGGDRGDQALRPYALRPPVPGPNLMDGDEVDLGLVLFGDAVNQFSHLVEGLRRGAHRGVDRDSGALHLLSVAQEVPTDSGNFFPIYATGESPRPWPAFIPPPPPMPPSVGVVVETPLRLKRAGQEVLPRTFELADFINAVVRRGYELTARYGSVGPEDRPERLQRGEVHHQRLDRFAWPRSSNRGARIADLGGLVGEFEFDSDGLARYWPFVWAGQWFHVGSTATMGLGRYSLYVSQ